MKMIVSLALAATMGVALIAILARMTSDPILFFILIALFTAAIIGQIVILRLIERRADEDFLQDEKHWGGQ